MDRETELYIWRRTWGLPGCWRCDDSGWRKGGVAMYCKCRAGREKENAVTQ